MVRSAKRGRWQKQPNILMIMADQLTALALRAYGHPVVRTPHLDRLAAEGVRVRAAPTAISPSARRRVPR